MEKRLDQIFEQSLRVKQDSLDQNRAALIEAVNVIVQAFRKGHKLLIFGNGGSAADSQHIAAEFVGRFRKERQALPALALTTDTSALTALGNDYSFDIIFSRQIEGLAQVGDVALGISTSGHSRNVIEGMKIARQKGLRTIALTGGKGGDLAPLADIKIIVPSDHTARIQESHSCLLHCICELVEDQFA